MAVPKFYELMTPTLQALRELGGSGSIQEIEDRIVKILGLSDEDASENFRGNRTTLNYRLAWARNYLKRYGMVENSARGVWALTERGVKEKHIDSLEVRRFVRQQGRTAIVEDEESEEPEDEKSWEGGLLKQLMGLTPEQFEKLCQRLLREAGFTQVQVTGRSGDGGIDGTGVLRIGLVSFRIVFQCKRYAGSVPAKAIRDFRGSMVGRAEKGLFLTTGSFTKDAVHEASREGAPAIDLLDGEQLVLKMKELGLGVTIKPAEVVEVDPDWFVRFGSSE